MALIDLLLNLAGLIFWHGWRGTKAESPTGSALTLASNLKPAEVQRPRRWLDLMALLGLLLLRPIFYWHLGSALDWSAAWSPGPVILLFRSDFFTRMLLYSFVSFFWTLFVWHAWFCLLSAIHPRRDSNPILQGVREQLGWIGRWPGVFQFMLPFLVLGMLWYWTVPALANIGLMPAPRTRPQLVQQSLLIAASLLLTFRWLFSVVFVLRWVNTYVYLGSHPFWEFVHRSGRFLLWPLNWLRIGKLDFAPVAGLVLLWWLALMGERFLRQAFQSLPIPWP